MKIPRKKRTLSDALLRCRSVLDASVLCDAADFFDRRVAYLGDLFVAQVRRIQHIADDRRCCNRHTFRFAFRFASAFGFSNVFLTFFFLDFPGFFGIPLKHHHLQDLPSVALQK